MTQNKKTIMNHNLAKALMEAGMQHFDIGGMVGNVVGGQNQFQAGLAPTTQSNYQPMQGQSASNVQSGYQNAQGLQGQQQNLANMLMNQAQGGGPNPAQQALQNATGQNIAAQGALMAGQRGASANPAALAKAMAMQGAATQQQAVGQSALMQAQQQLAAQGALAGQQQNMVQGNLGQQQIQGNMYSQAGQLQNAQNLANIQNTQQANTLNQKTAAENAAAAGKAGGGFLGGLGSILSGPLGTLAGTALGGPLGGTLTGALGGALSGAAKYKGGEVEAMARGGKIGDTGRPKTAPVNLPAHFSHIAAIYHPELMNQGGIMDYTSGGGVPGQAMVDGDSPRNDTVPALVSPGEVVLPRSVTQAPDAPSKAAEFMRHLHAKEDAQKGYAKVAATKKGKK